MRRFDDDNMSAKMNAPTQLSVWQWITGVVVIVSAMSSLAQSPAIPSSTPPVVITSSATIPASVTEALAKSQVPIESVAILVREVGARDALIAHNLDRAMNPASVMKLVTTYSALELLGPAYVWKTDVLINGDIRNNTLTGDLILKGGGDPKLSIERFWLLLKQLRERGLKNIKGDLVIDKSFFGEVAADPARFDGETLRAYNVGPDAMLVNFKTVRFFFVPAIDDKSVSISPDVKPAQLEIVNRTKLIEGPCGDWRERIKMDVQNVTATQIKVTFTGNYPRNCGERVWNVSLLDHARFVGGVFANMWSDLGGTWQGAVRIAATPAEAKLIATAESSPLADAVRDINKFSNNVMARQLYLTLSAETDKQPGTTARSLDIVKTWLTKKGINATELVIENGSGLSRIERISATSLAQLLDNAWRSSVMPEFISSLSLVGIDGTLRRRARGEPVVGNAHMKTGTLNDVRAVAGYVLASDGKRYIAVMIINHPNAPLAQAAQDQFISWVYQRP